MHSNFRRLMAVRLQLGIVRCWDKCEVLRGPPYCPNMALSIREGMWHPASITRRERRGAATGLRRHPRWRRRAPLALSSPSRRPSPCRRRRRAGARSRIVSARVLATVLRVVRVAEWWRFRVGLPERAGPLPDVAGHVEQTIRARTGAIVADRGCLHSP